MLRMQLAACPYFNGPRTWLRVFAYMVVRLLQGLGCSAAFCFFFHFLAPIGVPLLPKNTYFCPGDTVNQQTSCIYKEVVRGYCGGYGVFGKARVPGSIPRLRVGNPCV